MAVYNAGLGSAKLTWDFLKDIFDCFGPCISSRIENIQFSPHSPRRPESGPRMPYIVMVDGNSQFLQKMRLRPISAFKMGIYRLLENASLHLLGILEATDAARRVFKFEAGPQTVAKTYEPSQYTFQDATGRREGHLKPKDGTSLEWYLRALNIGASDPAIVLKSGRKTQQDRARFLLSAFELLVEKDGTIAGLNQIDDWENLYLITPTWIEDANTIMRRLTTGGGINNDLVDHICNCISTDSESVKAIRVRLSVNALWQENLRTTVKEFCMFDVNSFEFVWDMDALNRSEKNPIKEIVRGLLPKTVAKLSEKEEDSWIKNLSKIMTAEKMVKVLNLPRLVVNRPVIVLKEELKKWDYVVEIRG